MSETRNELLLIRNLKIAIDKNDDIDFQFDYLLERFQIELDRKKEDLKHELEKVENDIKVLEYVKKEVLKNEK